MIYTIKVKGTITIEAGSETQALNRAYEVLESIEDCTHLHDASILLETKNNTIKTKKDKQ